MTEGEIRAARKFALLRMKIPAEPSGAAAMAAVMRGKLPKDLGRAGMIVSGGNADSVAADEVPARTSPHC